MYTEAVSNVALPEVVQRGICELAQEYEAEKVVLFGSRARGDHREKSDIDLAVYGCSKFSLFALDVEERVWTLLTFDVINMDEKVSPDLLGEIERDGVVLYEKV